MVGRRKKDFLLIWLPWLLMLAACSHGKTERFPSGALPPEAAEVFVIRDDSLFGWGFSLDVLLDAAVIARLRSGEYISFYVKPGFHTVGISKSSITVPFEAGKKYYFLISPDYSKFGFAIDRLGEKNGSRRVAVSRPLR